jgi:hypothetical protein
VANPIYITAGVLLENAVKLLIEPELVPELSPPLEVIDTELHICPVELFIFKNTDPLFARLAIVRLLLQVISKTEVVVPLEIDIVLLNIDGQLKT